MFVFDLKHHGRSFDSFNQQNLICIPTCKVGVRRVDWTKVKRVELIIFPTASHGVMVAYVGALFLHLYLYSLVFRELTPIMSSTTDYQSYTFDGSFY